MEKGILVMDPKILG